MPKATDSVAERGAFVVVGGLGAILARIRWASPAPAGRLCRALVEDVRPAPVTGRMDA